MMTLTKKHIENVISIICEKYFPDNHYTGDKNYSFYFLNKQEEKDFYSALSISKDKIPKESIITRIIIQSPSNEMAKITKEKVYGYTQAFSLSELVTCRDKEALLQYRIYPALEKACKMISKERYGT